MWGDGHKHVPHERARQAGETTQQHVRTTFMCNLRASRNSKPVDMMKAKLRFDT